MGVFDKSEELTLAFLPPQIPCIFCTSKSVMENRSGGFIPRTQNMGLNMVSWFGSLKIYEMVI